MWFLLVLIIIAVAFVVYNLCDKYCWNDNIQFVCFLVIILFVVIALVMLGCIVYAHTNVEANLEANREIYNALTYKMESTTCRDEFGFLSKEVIDEVQEWNKDVRRYQASQDDFWVGIFYPNVFDEFKTIDYESYKG